MTTATDDTLRISFPARSGFLRICRITSTTFASDLGFDVDQLDDLRLAVDEAATWLLKDDTDAGGDVVLSLTGDEGGITVRGERVAAGLEPSDADDLVHAILGATVDAYRLDGEAGRRSIEITKQRT